MGQRGGALIQLGTLGARKQVRIGSHHGVCNSTPLRLGAIRAFNNRDQRVASNPHRTIECSAKQRAPASLNDARLKSHSHTQVLVKVINHSLDKSSNAVTLIT
eukprot:4366140-Amphidinium_carterae.1